MVPSGANAMSSAMPSGAGIAIFAVPLAVDLVERRARDAAGEQTAGLVDSKPVHAVERRARDELGDL